MEPNKVLERSVDSLERIYAVIIALAIGQSISILLVNPVTQTLELNSSTTANLPVFLAFAVTVVPFYHGMNRHLDECYIIGQTSAQGALLLDFIVFFLEAALLFATSVSVRAGLQAFLLLGMLLAIDTLWGTISHLIHKQLPSKGVSRWVVINLTTLVLAFFWVTWSGTTGPTELAGLLVLACLRTIADYYTSWSFYFPRRPVAIT
jgi:hypothetical protein